ncbi:SDR family NAD(P)-dependent oxidoreductase [Halomonas sp. TBZ9]|uniref:SDR family NAD(P)-dependent oxidoreductase n=1 Tax=Vreelandella azerica TaxID=2732867 RepID=A0A7Y3XAQ4_9GAMM|nr:SDR family NAD(P)-dependent oxidoreductase [Halomonas azerica]NOG31455.1 SDR family NAD(P)-dependent oxidoreductase [Halomonas azerica]
MTKVAHPGFETVIITGASSGIGSATAEKLAEQGKALILLARRKAPLEAMMTRLRQQHPQGTFIAIAGDLAHRQECEAVINGLQYTLHSHSFRLEGFIHCAGIGIPTDDLQHWKPDDLEAALALNVIAPLRLIQALLPYLDGNARSHAHFCRMVLVGAGIDRQAQPGTGTMASARWLYVVCSNSLFLIWHLIPPVLPSSSRGWLILPGYASTSVPPVHSPCLTPNISISAWCKVTV